MLSTMLADLQRLWRYRELLWMLAWRELLSRYKQSFLGPAWALLQPLSLMLIFTVVSTFITIPSDGVPYPLFCFAALLPWTMFTNALSLATPSIVQNAAIVKKIDFPREILPIAAVLVSLVDFAMAFLVLLGMSFYYERPPGLAVLVIPALLVLQLAFTIGIALITSALGTFRRDIVFAAVFLLQIWMYASPVIYPLSAVPTEWRSVYLLNPMAGLISSFRDVMVHQRVPEPSVLVPAAVGAVVALALGGAIFKRLERYYADVV